MLFIDRKLQVFTLPKAGSSSIKMWYARYIKLWFARDTFAEGDSSLDDVHKIFPDLPFEMAASAFYADEDALKIAVVRDPLRRLLSSYGNRVVYHRDLKKVEPKNLLGRMKFHWDHWGFKGLPDPNNFFLNLELYQRASPGIMHHTRSCQFFLGSDLNYFDRVFTLEDSEKLEEFLGAYVGSTVKLPREQTGGPKLQLDDLNREAILKIRGLLEGEYVFLKDFYDMPKRLADL